jgi:hypothetical protein
MRYKAYYNLILSCSRLFCLFSKFLVASDGSYTGSQNPLFKTENVKKAWWCISLTESVLLLYILHFLTHSSAKRTMMYSAYNLFFYHGAVFFCILHFAVAIDGSHSGLQNPPFFSSKTRNVTVSIFAIPKKSQSFKNPKGSRLGRLENDMNRILKD